VKGAQPKTFAQAPRFIPVPKGHHPSLLERTKERQALKAMMTTTDQLSAFLDSLGRLPIGFVRGSYGGSPYGVTVDRSASLGCTKLFARELAGSDIVSFNLYRTPAGRVHLRPCEMSSAKVIDFVRGFSADTSGRSPGTIGKGA
jgi:hypothetical protein